MEAIADNAQKANEKKGHQLLAEYVNRVLTLFESAKDMGYPVDLTADFGIAAAFVVLVYCCLWRIIQRLKQSGDLEPVEFTTLMLPLQEVGEQNDEGNGDSYVYAAAQALEAILSENTPIRMQGVVLQNLAKQTEATKYIKQNIFNALLSAFPIAISTATAPTISKIGVISYRYLLKFPAVLGTCCDRILCLAVACASHK